MFEETRKRREGRTYKLPYDDTSNKIARMKKIEELQEDDIGESSRDAFDEVMMKEHPGRLRLHGRGVSGKWFKGKEVVSSEILESQATQLAKMQKLSNELEAQASKVADMQKHLDSQKEKMSLDVVAMAYAQLRKMVPNITSEMITQAIVSSIDNTASEVQDDMALNEDE